MACFVSPSGLALQSANGVFGASNANLVIYDETTVNGNLSGPIVNTAMTCSFVRIGNLVRCGWPTTLATANQGAAALSWSGAIPSGFLPNAVSREAVVVAGGNVGACPGLALAGTNALLSWSFNQTNVVTNGVEYGALFPNTNGSTGLQAGGMMWHT